MARIFIPVIGLVFLLQAVSALPVESHSEDVPSPDQLKDQNWIYPRVPDNPQRQLQPEDLRESPMNKPEEDRDMIHHGSDFLQQDLLPRMNQPAEALSLQAHRLPMVLPYEPMNEPEEDRDMIYHGF
ncbi:uncharacterized protein [Mobula birostris]|uniref:uncharacterized protein n=1 Tax=Mobula birostris TaxID=1983395 RepID=UPI003B2855B0